MNIIIMGPQGAGKSTQGRLLAKKLNLPYIGTGNIYRDLAEENTPLGNRIKEVLEKGGLIDDQTTLEVVDKNIAKIQGGFVLDGFPRTLAQAERELFPIDKVIYIYIPDAVAVERLSKRGRADDEPEIIKERLRLFHDVTEPILDLYRRQGKLLDIDGTPDIDSVARQINI